MFFLKWAYKNLVANKPRTIGMIIFLAVVITIMMVNLLFLEGTNTQMKASFRNNKGDLYLWAPDKNVSNVYDYLQKYRPKLENRIRFFSKSGQLIGTSGYAEGWVMGTEKPFLKYLNRNVSWREEAHANLREGTTIVEAGLAEKLNVKRGDAITIKVKTERGMINTLRVVIDGIFIGSNLIYRDVLFINLKDQNISWLTEDNHNCNELKLYFNTDVTNDELAEIQQELAQTFPTLSFFSPKLHPEADQVFMTFTYYRYVLLFLFTLLNIVFIVILYFTIQNLFFMSFRERRQELATLLTYGMKSARIKLVVVWEAVMIFIASLALSIPFTLIITAILHSFRISDPSLAELIAAIGGPRLFFTINWEVILATLSFILIVILFSAYKGANTYLKLEIREILSNV